MIVIIALGESIVAIGVGAGDEPLSASVGVAAVLSLLASAALWWAYFDVVAPVAHRRLGELDGVARNTLARDSFAYLHLPMIAGIELFALGVEQVVGHVDEPLTTEASAALFGGVGLYLLGARRVPAAQRRHAERPAARRGARVRRVHPAGDRDRLRGGARGASPPWPRRSSRTRPLRFSADRARVRMQA